jgi:hypothetical protein
VLEVWIAIQCKRADYEPIVRDEEGTVLRDDQLFVYRGRSYHDRKEREIYWYKYPWVAMLPGPPCQQAL